MTDLFTTFALDMVPFLRCFVMANNYKPSRKGRKAKSTSFAPNSEHPA